MATLEKQHSKQGKKKSKATHSVVTVAEDIPNAPKLEDFCIYNTTAAGVSYEETTAIEREILDAVKDEVQTSVTASETPHLTCRERGSENIIEVEAQVQQISLEDVHFELDTGATSGAREWNDCEQNETRLVVETELQEIHSYTLPVHVLVNEIDTRLESPCHLTGEHSEPAAGEIIGQVCSMSVESEIHKPSAPIKEGELSEPVSLKSGKPLSATVTSGVKEQSAQVLQKDTRSDSRSHSRGAASKSKHLKRNKAEKLESVQDCEQLETIKPFPEVQLSSLYSNHELECSAQFVTEFIDDHLRGSVQHHRLHELLVSYLRARNRLIVNSMDLEDLKKECIEHQNHLWVIETTIVSESGECQDGNPVSASHEYRVSRFNSQSLASLNRTLTSIKDLVNEVHSLNSYSAEVLRLKIEHYVQNVTLSCQEFSRLPHNAPVCLLVGEPPPNVLTHLNELRVCVSILFTFQRRSVKDKQFIADTRGWLSQLLAVLLRVATWKDHLFVLNHVLRCPAGIGSWAANYVQAPAPPVLSSVPGQYGLAPFTSPVLNHLVVVLATILLPIRNREHFLEQVRGIQECSPLDLRSDGVWVMVDSDGEEDEDINRTSGSVLRENDMVALLNQVPIDSLFRHILLVDRRDDRDIYDPQQVSENHVLRLFAFSTVLVRLLKEGLRTYDSPRYRQFAKRLGRLIRHTVQYASDQWESFRLFHTQTDQAMLQRLQVEYDAFFLRATQCIFSSQRLGTWQFLAVIPYNVVSISTLWKLFYILHEDYHEEENLSVYTTASADWEQMLQTAELRQQFEEKLTSMPEAESFYLLTTFANMAMARTEVDTDFVQTATLDLFQVGFLSSATQESCSKSARVLLSNITSKHPTLLSEILKKLSENFSQAGKLSLYLFKELPLRQWVPSEKDMQILSCWLLEHPLSSTENNLCRLVLSSLNWGCNERGLCLDHSLHRRVAALIVEAMGKFVPESPGGSMITDSMKQVSSYASAMVRPQSHEQLFSAWSWEMVSRLRLHFLDQSSHTAWTAMANPAEAFAKVPDLDSAQDLVAVGEGVAQRQPIACHVAVLLTLWGHSVPLICTKGFHQLQVLQCYYRHEAALVALHHLVPLFLNCEESLLQSDRYLSIIISLITADKTYMKMAKNLIAPEFPGPVLKLFGNMIESHLENYRRYSLVSPRAFVCIWLLSLSLVPDWTKESGVLYLMDIILCRAFFHNDARDAAVQILGRLHQNLSGGPKHGGTLSSFISWVASGAGHMVSLMSRLSCAESPWFAYMVLEMEDEVLLERTGLWKELLKELALTTGKANIDQALKKAAHNLKISTPPSASLSIYRWAQQALDTPLEHPLLPLIWQKFFILFLERVPSFSGVPDRGAVGGKFFEGMMNLSFHKKLKKRLQDATEYFRAKSTEEPEEQGDAEEVVENQAEGQSCVFEKRAFYSRCSQLMRTFSLWLEEPRLQEANLFLPALPPQYNSELLAGIMQGDKRPCLKYLDYDRVREIQQQSVHCWQVANFRTEDHGAAVLMSSTPEEPSNPVDRILNRLKAYDQPLPPPALRAVKAVIPHVNRDMLLNRGSMLDGLKFCFKSLLEYAQIYSLRTSEHMALDCNFVELVPLLYRDVEMEVVLHAACDSEPQSPRKSNHITCAGPAAIRIKVCEARVSEGTEHLIQQNRNDFDAILARATQSPPQKVVIASVYLEHVIRLLEQEFREATDRKDHGMSRRLQDVGASLFYHLVSLYGEDVAFYPPTKQLLTTCMETLGQVFISGDEEQCVRLLSTAMQQPQLGGILGPHLTPAAAGTATFLQMYANLVESIGQQSTELSFVLLSKFDITKWLVTRRPRLSERSTFIELLMKALTSMGLTPAEDKLMLHEVFRKHLRLILLHDFPEHYGEILNLTLQSSEAQTLSPEVWGDLLATLGGISGSGGVGRPRDEARKFATGQTLLSHQELRETAGLLGCHFTKERLHYGLYGLYPKYRVYVEPLTAFLGMVGHGLLASTLQHDRGTLSDKLCEHLWPSLRDMFSPWIAPYLTHNLKEPTAAWIQQLTDDRSVLLPWITADGPHAERMVSMFVECVRFILDTLPACSNILGFVWQYYVASYAHSAVKDHVLNIVHSRLLTLPWDRFWPTVQDVEMMQKVVDQYLPDCHALLGSIFVEVAWEPWVSHTITCPALISARTHLCLLHLLVKVGNEPSARQSPKLAPLLLEAQKFAWNLIDCSGYEPVVNWYVMSGDPRVILPLEGEEVDPLDSYILELLQVVASMVPYATQSHPSAPRKRQVFMRAAVKLLLSAASRHKALVTSQEAAFRAAVTRLLDLSETVMLSSTPEGQRIGEAGLLWSELLVVVHTPGPVSPLALDAALRWVAARSCDSPGLLGLLRVLGPSPLSGELVGPLLEAATHAFFSRTVSQTAPPEWPYLMATLQPFVPRQPPLEASLVSGGHILALYAALLQRLPHCRDIREEGSVLTSLTDWLMSIKPTEVLESKLPLLWGQALHLSYRQLEHSGDADLAGRSLRRLGQYLGQLSEDRGGAWGILGAIGLRKQSPVSIRCRLLSRALAAFVLAQLPEGEQAAIRTTPHAPGAVSLQNCESKGDQVIAFCRRNSSGTVGPSPSQDATKAVNSLESLGNSKQYQELRNVLDLSLKLITDPQNSLHNAVQVLGSIATELYDQQYLLILKM